MAVAPKYGFLGEEGEKCLWVAAGIGAGFLGGGIAGGATIAFGGMTYAASRWSVAQERADNKRMIAFFAVACFTAISLTVANYCSNNGHEVCRLGKDSEDCNLYNMVGKASLFAAGIFGFATGCLGIKMIQPYIEENF